MKSKKQRFVIVAVIVVVIQVPAVAVLLSPVLEKSLGPIRFGLAAMEAIATLAILGFAWILLNRREG